jgi:hypothetical protein
MYLKNLTSGYAVANATCTAFNATAQFQILDDMPDDPSLYVPISLSGLSGTAASSKYVEASFRVANETLNSFTTSPTKIGAMKTALARLLLVDQGRVGLQDVRLHNASASTAAAAPGGRRLAQLPAAGGQQQEEGAEEEREEAAALGVEDYQGVGGGAGGLPFWESRLAARRLAAADLGGVRAAAAAEGRRAGGAAAPAASVKQPLPLSAQLGSSWPRPGRKQQQQQQRQQGVAGGSEGGGSGSGGSLAGLLPQAGGLWRRVMQQAAAGTESVHEALRQSGELPDQQQQQQQQQEERPAAGAAAAQHDDDAAPAHALAQARIASNMGRGRARAHHIRHAGASSGTAAAAAPAAHLAEGGLQALLGGLLPHQGRRPAEQRQLIETVDEAGGWSSSGSELEAASWAAALARMPNVEALSRPLNKSRPLEGLLAGATGSRGGAFLGLLVPEGLRIPGTPVNGTLEALRTAALLGAPPPAAGAPPPAGGLRVGSVAGATAAAGASDVTVTSVVVSTAGSGGVSVMDLGGGGGRRLQGSSGSSGGGGGSSSNNSSGRDSLAAAAQRWMAPGRVRLDGPGGGPALSRAAAAARLAADAQAAEPLVPEGGSGQQQQQAQAQEEAPARRRQLITSPAAGAASSSVVATFRVTGYASDEDALGAAQKLAASVQDGTFQAALRAAGFNSSVQLMGAPTAGNLDNQETLQNFAIRIAIFVAYGARRVAPARAPCMLCACPARGATPAEAGAVGCRPLVACGWWWSGGCVVGGGCSCWGAWQRASLRGGGRCWRAGAGACVALAVVIAGVAVVRRRRAAAAVRLPHGRAGSPSRQQQQQQAQQRPPPAR